MLLPHGALNKVKKVSLHILLLMLPLTGRHISCALLKTYILQSRQCSLETRMKDTIFAVKSITSALNKVTDMLGFKSRSGTNNILKTFFRVINNY